MHRRPRHGLRAADPCTTEARKFKSFRDLQSSIGVSDANLFTPQCRVRTGWILSAMCGRCPRDAGRWLLYGIVPAGRSTCLSCRVHWVRLARRVGAGSIGSRRCRVGDAIGPGPTFRWNHRLLLQCGVVARVQSDQTQQALVITCHHFIRCNIPSHSRVCHAIKQRSLHFRNCLTYPTTIPAIPISIGASPNRQMSA